ncbi:MAG: 4-phosphoerythronate dehydrogenase [Verrucomicrobiota bacterium]
MKIVCATSVLFGKEAFSTLGEVELVPEREISSEHLVDADALITRSKVKVNHALLAGTKVRFVGTATAGFDHIDVEDLEERRVTWKAARGCNANSVAEYFVSAMLCLSRRHNFTLEGKRLGVIGVGEVGSRVVQKARLLGMRVIQNDPPKKAATGDAKLVTVKEVLANSDIVTLHTPLTTRGAYATNRMCEFKFFQQIKPGSIFINASRGEIAQTEAILPAMECGRVALTVLDVWEDEPACPLPLLQKASIGTPHIAGYSFEGRAEGTQMIYREACQFFGQQAKWTWKEFVSDPEPINIHTEGRPREEVLQEVVSQAYDIEMDDYAFRTYLSEDPTERTNRFRKLRLEYPERREFNAFEVRVDNQLGETSAVLAKLGFRVKRV